MIALNADMPRNCVECKFDGILHCYVPRIQTYPFRKVVEVSIEGRPKDCPLKQVSELKMVSMFYAGDEIAVGHENIRRQVKKAITADAAGTLDKYGKIHYEEKTEFNNVHGQNETSITGRLYVVDM